MASPVEYMLRSRDYYRAHGYATDYTWAHFDSVPFARLARPLSECTVALVSTSSPMPELAPAPAPGRRRALYSGPSDAPPERLATMHVAWDKEATHTDDLGSYFPIAALAQFVAEGRIGRLAARYHCVPTEYSQRLTTEVDAPEILRRCRQDDVDAALLVPL